MKNYFSVSISMLVILLLSVGATYAQQVIFQDNFDDGNTDGWKFIDGEWKVEDKTLARVDKGVSYSKAMTGDINWKDYTVEADVKLVEAVGFNCAGFVIRADEDGNNGYRFWIRTDEWKCQFSKWENSKFVHVVEKFVLDIKVGETYHLKATVEGQRYRCFVNDTMTVDYEDTSKFRENGRVGLITYAVYPQFDNIKISSSATSAVKHEEKLTTLWGKVKMP